MSENVIEVRDLVKTYGELKAVDEISFEVRAGEVFSILGPNGAGKTTTVEMLECIRKPTSGTISILGHSTRNEEMEIKQRIGVIPQDFTAYATLTVRENIQYFANLYERTLPIEQLITAVNLGDKRNDLFKNLSGGLKQRVGIAISMVNDPEIVFLDEPTTGLDPKARREVWEIIRSLKERRKTVILTTHYMEEAEVLSDRVAIMNAGKFIAFGTPREIIEKFGSGSLCVVRGASEPARKAVSSVGLTYEIKDGDISVHAQDRTVLPKIVKALESVEAPYDEILIKKPTLEDVFLKLTGRKLDESEGATA